jgi:uncharacterized phage protein gp47/JayE
MSSYGVTDTGFVIKTLAETLEDIEAEQRNQIGGNLNQSASSLLGTLNGIFADHITQLYEVAAAQSAAMDPETATGTALDYLASLAGLTRRAATFSTVSLTFTVDQAITIPAGTVVSVDGDPDITFATDADVVCGAAGDFAAAATAETTGPVNAAAGTLTVLESTVTGVTAVTNALDATQGNDIETDAELRDRRVAALANAGAGTAAAVRAAVLEVENVTEAEVFSNRTNATDADGLPAHSIEVLVAGGTDDDIAQAIHDTAAAADGLHSSTADSGSATDYAGNSVTIPFTRPTDVALVVEVDIEVDGSLYGVSGDTNVQTAIAEYIDSLSLGEDVKFSRLYGPIFAVPGVTDINEVRLDTKASGSPVEQSITIAARENATIEVQASDITVTVL